MIEAYSYFNEGRELFIKSENGKYYVVLRGDLNESVEHEKYEDALEDFCKTEEMLNYL